MGGIALLLPREDMQYQAHNVLQEKHYDIDQMQVIHTEETITAARTAIARGARILIARGLQASLIKQYTDVPVAEIVVTAQEMGLLMVKAKEIVKKPTPVIAVVGFRNMLSDMSYFNTIYEVELRTYFASSNSLLEESALEAVEDQADLVIGGELATRIAGEHGIPSLFLSTTEDALRRAFDVAQRMLYAIRREEGLERTAPGAADEGLPSYYHPRKPVMDRETGRRKPALVQFADLTALSPAMRQCVEQAERYARLDGPVLITGEPGTEKELLAQCMHNASARSDASFFCCSCTGPEGEQTSRLFEEQGLIRQASGGTLYLTEVEHLSPYQQFGLYQVIRRRQLPELAEMISHEKRGWPVNVRIMASAGRDLAELAAAGKFMPELAAMFGGLVLSVPPLRERPEDLEAFCSRCLHDADERLGTYHVLSKEARQVFFQCPWTGNTLQLEAFCSRLAVEARRRTISGALVKQLYGTLYPQESQSRPAGQGQKEAGGPVPEEENRICQAWMRQSGNRQKMAEELGISTATLWRRMKKYGLTDETIIMK